MQISPETTLDARLDRLCAAEGHAAVFQRCGPTARRHYRASSRLRTKVRALSVCVCVRR
jgi:hypothetical protein